MADPDETLAKAIAAAVARYEGGGSDVWRGAARAAVAAVRAAGWVPADEKRNDGSGDEDDEDDRHHEGLWALGEGECGCECPRCWRQPVACLCHDCDWHGHDHTERDRRRDAQVTL